MYNSHNLAISIKSIAKEKNIIIKDMLTSCDLGSNTMSSLYHGKSIAFDSVAKIADYLNVSVDYLLGRTEEPQRIHNTQNNNISINETKSDISEIEQEMLTILNSLSIRERINLLKMAYDYQDECVSKKTLECI